MKILTLLGSAKKKGNTATVLGWTEQELEAMGHEVERIELAYQDIRGCMGCAACRKYPEEIACVQNDDDTNAILEKMVAADAVVFASPVYFWGVTGQMKLLMDRSYALVTNYHQPDHTSLMEGKTISLITTGGSPFENNAEPVYTAFDRFAGFLKTEKGGELHVQCRSHPSQVEGAEERARELAKELVG